MFAKSIEEIKAKEDNTKTGFLSTIFDFLHVIFKLSLINFHQKKSKFTLVKTFDDYFKQKIKDDNLSFQNFICQLSEELKAIKDFLDTDSDDKDFKPKDLNMDILISCVNNSFLFCVNKLSYGELISSLKRSFNDLLKMKKIQLNKESKVIISSFNSNIDMNLNYINEIKGANYTFKKLEEKEEINIHQYLEKIKKLQKEVSDYKSKLDDKEKVIQDYQKKNEKLNSELSETKIKDSLDKSIYEEIQKGFSNQIADMLNKHSNEINTLHEKINKMDNKMKSMEKEIQDIRKDNNDLKLKLNLSEKKLEVFQVLMTAVRDDMNALNTIGIDFSNNLDETLKLLEQVKISLETYDIELENFSNIFC